MELETKRLILRPLSEHDAPALARLRLAEPQAAGRLAIAFKCAPDELIGIADGRQHRFSESCFGLGLERELADFAQQKGRAA